MKTIELVAFAFGIVSVFLSVRQHIASWPTAIVNVLLSAIVFYKARLYADMGLQVVYAVLSVYGWYEWLYGGAGRTRLPVSRVSARMAALLVVIGAAFAGILGTVLARGTDASIPYLDSALTSASLVAQWMMTRKILENWAVWIVLDIVYVPTFISRDLPWMAGLYAVFLGLAVLGFIEWRRALAAQRTDPPPGLPPHAASAYSSVREELE